MTSRDRNFWIELSVLLLLLAAGVAAFVISSISPLNKDDLKIQAGDLRTFASVGHQLAVQYASGRLTETFFRSQTELVSDKVESARSSLANSGAEPNVADDLAAITRLSEELQGSFNDLLSTSDPSVLAGRLRSLEDKAKSSEDKLK